MTIFEKRAVAATVTKLGLAVAVSFLGAPSTANAQQSAKVSRIGMLSTTSPEHPQARATLDQFRQALGELGYVEGRNIVLEHRSAEGRVDRYPALATELVRLKVDLIVVFSSPAARAARQATATIPIVAPTMQDPVRDGLIASLARPGGNVTGLTYLGSELVPKRLALLKEAVPGVSRVAVLWHPGGLAERTGQEMVKEAEAAARGLGIQLQLVRVEAPEDLDGAFSSMTRGRADALIPLPSPMLFAERQRIVDLAARHRLPAMYMAREFVDLGGLMSYGASQSDLIRRGATYVDKILRGAKPADLPVEQPNKYEFLINLKTAKALKLTIPAALAQRADQAIE
jgi:putative ABC transport system substrate-binding protein